MSTRTTDGPGVQEREAVESDGHAKPPRRRITSSELLGGRNELYIEHNGEFYTLRLTSKGKLILTK